MTIERLSGDGGKKWICFSSCIFSNNVKNQCPFELFSAILSHTQRTLDNSFFIQALKSTNLSKYLKSSCNFFLSSISLFPYIQTSLALPSSQCPTDPHSLFLPILVRKNLVRKNLMNLAHERCLTRV